jgi:hypothetical protein
MTEIALAPYDDMTALDLVGPYAALARPWALGPEAGR